jgi:hypothetical protein
VNLQETSPTTKRGVTIVTYDFRARRASACLRALSGGTSVDFRANFLRTPQRFTRDHRRRLRRAQKRACRTRHLTGEGGRPSRNRRQVGRRVGEGARATAGCGSRGACGLRSRRARGAVAGARGAGTAKVVWWWGGLGPSEGGGCEARAGRLVVGGPGPERGQAGREPTSANKHRGAAPLSCNAARERSRGGAGRGG